MRVTFYVCLNCRQSSGEMKPVPEGGPGAYQPTPEELARDPYPALENRSHEEFICACGRRHNWYSLVASEETVTH